MPSSKSIWFGEPENSKGRVQYKFEPSDNPALLAKQFYNAMYESTETTNPAGPNANREALFGPGNAPEFSPFRANYSKETKDGREFIWPLNVAVPPKFIWQANVAVPSTFAAATAVRKPLNDEVSAKSVQVHQRGYAFTNSESLKYFLNTQSMSPCITMIVWNKSRQTAALAHVDKLQGFKATVDAMFNRVTGTPDDPVRVHFHGGNCSDKIAGSDGVYVSTNTAIQLLTAILQRDDTDSICISSMDVVRRDHGNSIAFDVRNGMVLPEIGEFAPFQLDSLYRFIRVQEAFSQRFPEDFYAEKSNDPLSQMTTFNRTVGGAAEQNTANRASFPINPDLMLLPRMQTDLRTVDTARNPAAIPPIAAFLNASRTTLFTWAAIHLCSLAPPVRPKFTNDALYKALLEVAGLDATDIQNFQQAKEMYPKVAIFERCVRRQAKQEEEGSFKPYLLALANALAAGKSLSSLKNVSKDWMDEYITL